MTNLLCAICRESLGVGSLNKSCTLPCGHVFHDHCIYNWLERSPTCPHCRIPSSPDHIIKLYFDLAEDSQVSELETLRNEVQRLKAVSERTDSDLKSKSDECKNLSKQLVLTQKNNETLRKEAKVLHGRIEKLKVTKLEHGRQKAELKSALAALEKEKSKAFQLSRDIKKFQKDFQSLRKSETKLKADYSKLFSIYKALEKSNTSLIEKSSIQERIIETYKADLNTSSNAALSSEPCTSAEPETKMDVDESNPGPASAKKVMLRRSPRNVNKRSSLNEGSKVTASRQLNYDGLGGRSAPDTFPSAKLKSCRIVSSRRK
ncbi:unnamed protein product [Nezara viridula]|uniref:RING-type domain-containing protein n=1 Tax=Nezara viridula TaxID=85310 RepID=A0A9P0H436_NEZVI|nr:unnamed protein product [Nezara viridula]